MTWPDSTRSAFPGPVLLAPVSVSNTTLSAVDSQRCRTPNRVRLRKCRFGRTVTGVPGAIRRGGHEGAIDVLSTIDVLSRRAEFFDSLPKVFSRQLDWSGIMGECCVLAMTFDCTFLFEFY